jgi:hypothetical protein
MEAATAALSASLGNQGATTSSQTGAPAGLKAEAVRGRDRSWRSAIEDVH